MKVNSNINPEVLAGAVGLLRSCCPDLTAEGLVKALSEKPEKKQETLTVKEYAEKYKICTMTVWRMISRNELPVKRIGKRCVRIIEGGA